MSYLLKKGAEDGWAIARDGASAYGKGWQTIMIYPGEGIKPAVRLRPIASWSKTGKDLARNEGKLMDRYEKIREEMDPNSRSFSSPFYQQCSRWWNE